jgi:hypothetical protein
MPDPADTPPRHARPTLRAQVTRRHADKATVP